MAGLVTLEDLLKLMSPKLQDGEYVFCTVNGRLADYVHLEPLGCFNESEGLTLILLVGVADREKLKYEGQFKQITLTVHSSLEAVGLTAAISEKLASYNISANVVAAYFHDHIFVPSEKASKALLALQEFSSIE